MEARVAQLESELAEKTRQLQAVDSTESAEVWCVVSR